MQSVSLERICIYAIVCDAALSLKLQIKVAASLGITPASHSTDPKAPGD